MCTSVFSQKSFLDLYQLVQPLQGKKLQAKTARHRIWQVSLQNSFKGHLYFSLHSKFIYVLPKHGPRAWTAGVCSYLSLSSSMMTTDFALALHCAIWTLFEPGILLYVYTRPCVNQLLKLGLCQTFAVFRMSEMHVSCKLVGKRKSIWKSQKGWKSFVFLLMA